MIRIAQRDKLDECLRSLRNGDVLIVNKPARLARTTAELLTIEQGLTARGVGLVGLSMGGERIDTRNPTSKLIMTILDGVVTWEREIMLERQSEGIAKAKGEGRYLGRKQKIDATDVWRRVVAGEQSAAIDKALGVARSSVYRHLPGADDLALVRSHGTPEARERSIQALLTVAAA